MELNEKYDSAFLAILQNEGNLPGFLDALFSFLYRKTDFYLPLSEKMGFPPGAAFKLLSQAYKKYETLAEMRLKKIQQHQQQNVPRETQKKVVDLETESPVVHEEEVATSAKVSTVTQTNAEVTSSTTNKSSSEDGNSLTKKLKSAENNSSLNSEEINYSKSQTVNAAQIDDDASNQSSDNARKNADSKEGGAKSKASTSEAVKGEEKEEDEDPTLTKAQREFQSQPESYNGAQRENYSWSQSITDVDVVVKVPSHIRRGCDVTVEIKRRSLCVRHRGQTSGDDWVTVVDGSLTWDVHKDECLWSLEPGASVNVHLEKVQERWWEALLEDEPRISVRKIDASRPMTDLDDEAQAKIQEMMFNEHQKRLGLPQSNEMKVHDMLKKAWDADGSPFKGQPFDPSKVNVSGNVSEMPFPPTAQ